jgi:hypothetical protein
VDNKLSELSKPSAEVVSEFGDPEAFGERELKVLADIQKLAYGTKFYSQEYVSALIKRAEKAEAFRDQMVRYVVRLGTSVIDPTVVETILTAAERSKCVGDE